MTERYTPLQQACHWLTAVCVFAVLPIAWVFTHIKDGDPLEEPLYAWHETLGLTVLLLTVLRIASRVRHPAPALPGFLPRWDRILAASTHGVLYLVLLWMPLTGFVAATSYGAPPKLFNLLETPALFAKNDRLHDLSGTLHSGGQWLLYALLLLHVAGVTFQLLVTRSGTLARMLPRGALGGDR